MYDINEEKGTHYITMEYVSGQDLKGFIRQSGQMGVGTAISITKQICDGLSEAHKTGVIHRDLKPSNIMIDREGNVRIMDFGRQFESAFSITNNHDWNVLIRNGGQAKCNYIISNIDKIESDCVYCEKF
jgi:serine/threonine-protein kinase